ncbi:MAG: hypothetical protein ACFFG0_05535 [Candidatus Thorarchaeota archaeon]
MPCIPLKSKDGFIKGFMCFSKGTKVEVCKICGTFADKLCDYPIGKGKTCDIALCKEHAKRIGINLDLCPVHYKKYKKKGSL